MFDIIGISNFRGGIMYKSFKIVKVDSKYCDFLRLYDSRIIYNAGTKDLRPFIGVLIYDRKM